ncbi:transcriptional regulator NrdR [Candidatus Woesearchaeota archaeon]|nr:transcriptional regulator NrdR [Candidatus Woesearchaeota archaeon]
MKCPFCSYPETKVLETRETEEDITRRRRECLKCEKRFTTYEQIELINIMILKKNGTKEIFDRQKVIKSLQIACQKRPITQEQIEAIASKVESKLRINTKKEVTTKNIGEIIIKQLKKLDQVAYIRFASVYNDFQDIESFRKELEKLDSK